MLLWYVLCTLSLHLTDDGGPPAGQGPPAHGGASAAEVYLHSVLQHLPVHTQHKARTDTHTLPAPDAAGLAARLPAPWAPQCACVPAQPCCCPVRASSPRPGCIMRGGVKYSAADAGHHDAGLAQQPHRQLLRRSHDTGRARTACPLLPAAATAVQCPKAAHAAAHSTDITDHTQTRLGPQQEHTETPAEGVAWVVCQPQPASLHTTLVPSLRAVSAAPTTTRTA